MLFSSVTAEWTHILSHVFSIYFYLIFRHFWRFIFLLLIIINNSFFYFLACSYEVSLIDDDNTFMAGHLGVYGRFVLISEDVISLMHPHWGSTLLEISLNNIIDVLFIREADISPAGVFSIILKRYKLFYFFVKMVVYVMYYVILI